MNHFQQALQNRRLEVQEQEKHQRAEHEARLKEALEKKLQKVSSTFEETFLKSIQRINNSQQDIYYPVSLSRLLYNSPASLDRITSLIKGLLPEGFEIINTETRSQKFHEVTTIFYMLYVIKGSY